MLRAPWRVCGCGAQHARYVQQIIDGVARLNQAAIQLDQMSPLNAALVNESTADTRLSSCSTPHAPIFEAKAAPDDSEQEGFQA